MKIKNKTKLSCLLRALRSFSIVACLSWLILSADFANAQDVTKPIKIAIIGDTEKCGMVIDLLGAELIGKGFDLIERTEINKVFQEQRLNLTEKFNRDKCIKSGKLLRVDAFLLLSVESGPEQRNDPASKTSDLLRIRVIETVYGLRILDKFKVFEENKPEETVSEIMQVIVPISSKLTLAAGDSIPIGIVNIQRVELGENYKTLERILPKLLSSHLNKESQIIVLEREDLKLLHDEKLLTQGKNRFFWNSAVLIDGCLLKKSETEVELQLQLKNPGTKKVSTISGTLKPEELNSGIDNIAKKIVKKLLNSQSLTIWNPEQEAEEFQRKGKWLIDHSRRKEGITLLEIAHILQPENIFYTGTLFTHEWKSRGLQYPYRFTSYFCKKSEAVQYYTDLELAELVSLLLRQIQTGYKNGLLTKDIFHWTYAEALASAEDGYFAKEISVSSDEIRNMNRQNRKIYLKILNKAISKDSKKWKHRLVDQAWTSSDVPEEVIANVEKVYNQFIMPTEMGGEIPSSKARYEKLDILELPDCRITLFKNSSKKIRKLWKGYLEKLIKCQDPLVKFKSCLFLAEKCWRANNDKSKAKKYYQQMFKILKDDLKTPNEPFADDTKSKIRSDFKPCLNRLKEVDENLWMNILEELFEPLIKKHDAKNLSLWNPSHTFSTPYSSFPAKQFKSDNVSKRYISLQEKVLAVMERDATNQTIRRNIILLKDHLDQIKPKQSSRNFVSVILLKSKNPPTCYPPPPLSKVLKLQKNILWIGFRESYRTIVVAGVDLKKKKLFALWKTKLPKESKSFPLMDLAIYKNAIYLSVEGLGLVKFPGSETGGEKVFEKVEILTKKHGLPSTQITGIAQDGDKLWIGYGGMAAESGLGIYNPEDNSWQTVLCSTLGKKPFDSPFEMRNLIVTSSGKIFFEPVYTHLNGFWKLDTKTYKVEKLWEEFPENIENYSGQWLIHGAGVLMQFDPVLEKPTFILGCPWWKKRSKIHKWKQNLFVSEESMKKYSFNTWGLGGIDLSTAAFHGNELWARMGKTQIIILQRGKPIEEAKIIKNSIMKNDKASMFFSTSYGLILIGEKSVGLIDPNSYKKVIKTLFE